MDSHELGNPPLTMGMVAKNVLVVQVPFLHAVSGSEEVGVHRAAGADEEGAGE